MVTKKTVLTGNESEIESPTKVTIPNSRFTKQQFSTVHNPPHESPTVDDLILKKREFLDINVNFINNNARVLTQEVVGAGVVLRTFSTKTDAKREFSSLHASRVATTAPMTPVREYILKLFINNNVKSFSISNTFSCYLIRI